VSFGASIACNFLSAVDSIMLSKASKAHAVLLNEFFSFSIDCAYLAKGTRSNLHFSCSKLSGMFGNGIY